MDNEFLGDILSNGSAAADYRYANDAGSDLEYKNLGYDPLGGPNSARALKQAEEEGLKVLFPGPNELFIDIDNDHSFAVFERTFQVAGRYLGAVFGFTSMPSRNGLPGRHITVMLDHNVTEIERIALQACLGSDRMREILGLVQALKGDPHPTLFLEKGDPKLLTDGNKDART